MRYALLLLWWVAGAAYGVPQQLCLDEGERLCAWQLNPDAKETVVLVHGLNGSALNDWQDQLERLAQRYHVLTIALPGFERDSAQASHYSMGYFSRTVRRFTERYVDGPYHLVGHSMGGVIALRHALDYPQTLQRLVLSDLPGVLHRVSYSRERVGHWARGGVGEHAGLSAFVEKMTMKFIGSGEDINTAGESVNELLLEVVSDPVTLASMQLVRQNFSGQLGGISVPTLLLWGGEDAIAPLRTGYALNARLPNSHLVVIPGAGHMPMREQPEAFNRALMAFLDGTVPKGLSHTIPDAPAQTRRVAVCRDRSGERYQGDYARIELWGCDRVIIENARVRELVAHNSRLSVNHSYIGGELARAIHLRGADMKLTASRVRGETAIHADGSRVDVAGASLCAGAEAITAGGGSELVFSISELRTPHGEWLLHGYYQLERDQSLPGRQQ
ncbi:MAG: alpha/beta fold hydrolase [Pseudomonadota bacterium]